ncbi:MULTISPECIES: DUF5672 family protein [Glaesserella]|nr:MULTISPECIES: DUF5672 family protein [Glaesserella]AUI65935.1 hypothetical protein CJD39_04815 [Glaesserella sp. 15-184]
MAKKTLTIVSVTGSQAYAQGAVYSIETSFLELQHKISHIECLLISPERPYYCPSYIKHIPCKPFSYLEYNLFMLYGLGQFINTDFCLVVQNDGWVINGNNWKDDFFNYDYIGAPVPDLIEVVNNQYVRRFDIDFWQKHKDNLPPNIYESQNGGFSLRSRKLLNAPRALGLSLEISNFESFQQIPLEMKWNFNSDIRHAEDSYLSCIKRQILMHHGIKFAPRNIAAQFSVEYLPIQKIENIPLDSLFGCHFSSLLTLIGSKKVQVNVNIYSLNDFSTNKLLNLLSTYNYEFIVPTEFNKINFNRNA